MIDFGAPQFVADDEADSRLGRLAKNLWCWPISPTAVSMRTHKVRHRTPVGCSEIINCRWSMYSKSGARKSRLAVSYPPGSRDLIHIDGHSRTGEVARRCGPISRP